jgi:hypothetical protein
MRRSSKPKEKKMNSTAEQDEAKREAEARRRIPLSPELYEFLHLLDTLEDRFAAQEAN